MWESMENLIESMEIQHHRTNNNMEMKNHFHNSYEIIYITGGVAEFKINQRVYSVTNGCIIFISNLESHELKVQKTPYERYFILIKPESFKSLISHSVLASIFKNRPEGFNHVIELSKEADGEIYSIVKTMYKEYDEKNEFWQSILASQLQLLFVALYRNYTEYFPLSSFNKATEVILQIQKYIDGHYTEELSLPEVSKKFFTDMYYISHQFKKVIGYTFREYLILQRISKAKDELFYKTDDITTVGMNSGFNNVSHFIRIFKKYERITPYQYRKKYSKA